MPQASLYDDDIVTWSDQQASELRRLAASAPTNAVDWDNVIEEIECLGRSEPKGVESHLVHALAHILMFETQPSSLSALGWASEVEIGSRRSKARLSPFDAAAHRHERGVGAGIPTRHGLVERVQRPNSAFHSTDLPLRLERSARRGGQHGYAADAPTLFP